VVVGGDLVLPVAIAHDYGYRFGLNDQLVRHPCDLVRRAARGLLVVISDHDQVSHEMLLSALALASTETARDDGQSRRQSTTPQSRHLL
jgi:hypothetical protein